MTRPQQLEINTRVIVDNFYLAARNGHPAEFARYVREPFDLSAPAFLPRGGSHSGRYFAQVVLPQLTDVFDYTRFTTEQFYVQGNEALVIARVGIAGSEQVVRTEDTWWVQGGKVFALKSRIHEPYALTEQLRVAAAFSKVTAAIRAEKAPA